MTVIQKLSGLLKRIFILPIRFYQKFISPCLPRVCKYYPSCSRYAVDAINRHGVVKGILLGCWRILRCNPFSRGGVDYVPDKFEFFYYKRDLLKHENKQ